jgi:ADP-heptose:LPS heptosyltransferase
LINLQRFASTGLFASFSKARQIIGFKKNPFSFLFNKKVEHEIGNGKHEVERNQLLIQDITDNKFAPLKLYPGEADFRKQNILKKENTLLFRLHLFGLPSSSLQINGLSLSKLLILQ